MSDRTRDYRVACLSECLSPVTHMGRSEGNESLVAREAVVTPRGVAMIPCLSGNSIRHRCVRAPGFGWLVREYGLAGKLSLMQLNFLFHGGSLTEGGGREGTARIADWQRLFPLGRLLGGCLPDQVLAGSLLVGRGTLVCEENRPTLGAILPAGDDGAATLDDPARLRPAESFVSGYQYTRGDARKSRSDLAGPEGRAAADAEGAGSNLMIFSGQAVTRGAAFVHDFTLPHASEIELGALLWSLALWRRSGGTVGGQAARGHGRLATSLIAPDFDADAAVAAYVAHARSARDEAVAWLDAAFARKAERAAKGGAKGKAPASAEGETPPA